MRCYEIQVGGHRAPDTMGKAVTHYLEHSGTYGMSQFVFPHFTRQYIESNQAQENRYGLHFFF